MGGKGTKLLKPEEAREMLTDDEYETVTKSWTKLCGSLNGTLDPTSAKRYIFPYFPRSYQEKLYGAVGGRLSGISFNNALCALALLIHGTKEDKIRLLFAAYDHGQKDFLTPKDFSTLALNSEPRLPEIVNTYYETKQVNEMGFDDFNTLVQQHPDMNSFTKWVHEGISQLDQTHIPSYHETLAELTTFNPVQLRGLERRFVGMSPPYGEKFDRAHFVSQVCPPLVPSVARRLFYYFNSKRDNNLSFLELLKGLSDCAHTDDDSKRKYIWKLYMDPTKNVVTEATLAFLLQDMHALEIEFEKMRQPAAVHIAQPTRRAHRRSAHPSTSAQHATEADNADACAEEPPLEDDSGSGEWDVVEEGDSTSSGPHHRKPHASISSTSSEISAAQGPRVPHIKAFYARAKEIVDRLKGRESSPAPPSEKGESTRSHRDDGSEGGHENHEDRPANVGSDSDHEGALSDHDHDDDVDADGAEVSFGRGIPRPLTMDEFLAWCTDETCGVMLDAFEELLHTVFALQPTNPAIEAKLVHRRYLPPKCDPVGSKQFIVARSWFCAWVAYSGFHKLTNDFVDPSPSDDMASQGSSHSSASSTSHQTSSQARHQGHHHGHHGHQARSARTRGDGEPSAEADASTRVASIGNDEIVEPFNKKLLDPEPHLRPHSGKHVPYFVVRESMWRVLHSWYGGGPVIERRVVRSKVSGDHVIETFLMTVRVQVFDASTSTKSFMRLFGKGKKMLSFRGTPASHQEKHQSSSNPVISDDAPSRRNTASSKHSAESAVLPRTHLLDVRVSRLVTVRELASLINKRQRLLSNGKRGKDINTIRLWDSRPHRPHAPIIDDSATLEALNFVNGDTVTLEFQNDDQTWPTEIRAISAANSAASNEQAVDVAVVRGTEEPSEQPARTRTGLSNLGNTCYMNSALQCLVHTTPLSRYFLGGQQYTELNKDNPIGHKGVVALEYGKLVSRMHQGAACVAPVQWRKMLKKVSPQFASHQQHDSQEFLSFLLDALHEDLNRVLKKPYVERQDSNGRPDAVVAKESWEGHLMRNRSVVVDMFQGLIKSTVACAACCSESVTFDPYSYLSLPLPTSGSASLEIKFQPLGDTPPSLYALNIGPDQSYGQVGVLLAKLIGLASAESLIFVDLNMMGQIRKVADADERFVVSGRMVLAYEVDAAAARAEVEAQKQLQAEMANARSATNGNEGEEAVHLPSDAGEIARASDEGDVVPPPLQGEEGHEDHDTNACEHEGDCRCSKEQGPQRATEAPQKPPPPPRNFVPGHVMCALRKSITKDVNLLIQKNVTHNFGAPILIPFAMGATTNEDLYVSVWTTIRRFYSQRFQDEVSASREYPFVLRFVQHYAPAWCSLCGWWRGCTGCALPCDKGAALVTSKQLIVIDCTARPLHMHWENIQEHHVLNHASVGELRKEMSAPVTLEDCFETFTSEEKLDSDTWYCSTCKDHQAATKRLELWTLPPILVIHMKRFQLHNGRWVKSNKNVKFPVGEFRPYRYSAHVKKGARDSTVAELEGESSTEETLRGGDAVKEAAVADGDGSEEDSAEQSEEVVGEGGGKEKAQAAKNDDEDHDDDDDAVAEEEEEKADGDADVTVEDEKDIDFSKIDPHNKFYVDPKSERVYELYAISCHTGILGGGHYIAFAKGGDLDWYLFNDSACKQVSADAVQKNGNSVYLLFYKAQGLNEEAFLPHPDACGADGLPKDDALQIVDESKGDSVCALM